MIANTRLFFVASYMRDLSVVVDRFPLPGETRAGSGALESPGGKGSNQAIQAARCGASVSIVAAVGNDDAGRAALALWSAEGIDTSHAVSCQTAMTGLALILVNQHGENQIVIAPGANTTLAISDIDRAAAAIATADLVVAQLETPLPATVHAFTLARAAGVTTLLNTAPAPDSLGDVLWSVTDIVVANELEAATLTSLPASTDPLITGRALLARVGVAAVITLGDKGALLLRHNTASVHQPAAKVAVVDTTGAGDAFVGALAACWTRKDARQALAIAVNAGSLACTRRGAVAGLATPAELERLLN